MKTITLPNGLRVVGVSPTETDVLYHEIFEERAYERYGIEVHDGDCVFDVGANIGLFSLRAAQLGRHLSIFAFEPIPQLFAALEGNAGRHLEGHAVQLFPAASRTGAAPPTSTSIAPRPSPRPWIPPP